MQSFSNFKLKENSRKVFTEEKFLKIFFLSNVRKFCNGFEKNFMEIL